MMAPKSTSTHDDYTHALRRVLENAYTTVSRGYALRYQESQFLFPPLSGDFFFQWLT